MTQAFSRMATVTASTKRNPAMVGGKVAVPAAHLTSLRITPLMPIKPEIAVLYKIESPREAGMVFTESSSDVLEGDVLVIGALEYRIRGVGPWLSTPYLQLIVERVKGV